MKLKGSDKLHFRLDNSQWGLQPSTPQKNKAIQQLFGADDPAFLFPKESDFFYFPFRHLSKTIVGAGTWKATDFSEGDVLKNSLDLLSGVVACRNHYQGDIIGMVGKAKWNDGYTTPTGVMIPAGIDAPFIIDSKLFPELVRDLNKPADLNPMQCASVSVYFDYVASHDFEEEWMFERALGTMLNGEMVRRIVTEIKSYNESSLVFKGADKFAKKTDENGKIEKLPYSEATSFEQDALFGKDHYKETKEYYVYEAMPERLDFSEVTELSEVQILVIDERDEKIKNLQLALDGSLLRCANYASDEMALQAKITELKAQVAELQDLKHQLREADEKFATYDAKIATLTTEKGTLQNLYASTQEKLIGTQSQNAELQKLNGQTLQILNAKREEAKRLYLVETVSKGIGNKADSKILDEIASADFEKINLLLTIYGGRVAEGFGAVCADCGSHKVAYKSAESTDNTNLDKKAIYKGDFKERFE